MAEETVKRATGLNSLFPTIPDLSSNSIPLSTSPSEITDASVPIVHGDTDNLLHTGNDDRMKTRRHDIPSSDANMKVQNVGGGKMGRSASMQRVASLEHLQKRIRGGSTSCGTKQWEAGFNPEPSHPVESCGKQNGR